MIILITMVFVSSSGQKAINYYRSGLSFADQSAYDKAIEQFTIAIGLEPSKAEYYIARGQAYEELLKYSEAKADYEKALVFDPRNSNAKARLSVASSKIDKSIDTQKKGDIVSKLDKSDSGEQQNLTLRTNTTIKIGKQEWMAANLNVEMFRNGDPILYAETKNEWIAASENNTPAWCYYDGDKENGDKYGKLYNFYAFNDPRGLAPAGYRLPNDKDWDILATELGGKYVAGPKMRQSPENGGFFGILAGHREKDGEYYYLNNLASWWSLDISTVIAPYGPNLSLGRFRSVSGTSPNIIDETRTLAFGANQDFKGKYLGCGLSVRCLKEDAGGIIKSTGQIADIWEKRTVTKFQMQNPQTGSYEDIMFTNPGKYIEIRNNKDIRIQDLDMLEIMVQAPVAGRYKEGQFSDGVRESTTAELTIRYRGNFVLLDNNGLPSKQDLTIIDFFYDRNNKLSGLTYSSNICKCRAQIFFTDYQEGLQILK